MAVEKIKQVAVLDAGVMGHSITQVSAQGGYPVSLFDISSRMLGQAKRFFIYYCRKNLRNKITHAGANKEGANEKECDQFGLRHWCFGARWELGSRRADKAKICNR